VQRTNVIKLMQQLGHFQDVLHGNIQKGNILCFVKMLFSTWLEKDGFSIMHRLTFVQQNCASVIANLLLQLQQAAKQHCDTF